MSPQATDRLHFEIQIAYARPVVAVLAVASLLELRVAREAKGALYLLVAYLVAAMALPFIERALRKYGWHLPLACDILVVGLFLYFSPEKLPAWFLIFFVAFASGYRWNLKGAMSLSFGLLLLAIALQLHRVTQAGTTLSLYFLLPFFAATLLGAGAMAFLGNRNRVFTEQQTFLSQLTSAMHVEIGLAESLRELLEDLCGEFKTETALLAYRDADLERIFLWQLKSGESERLTPENLPVTRADGFLLDDLEASLCWNSLEGRGSGFGWDRRNAHRLKILPRIPGPTQNEFRIRNFLSVAFDQEDHPVGRIFLVNRRPGRDPFGPEDLAWFEKIARHSSGPLENIFLLRHLRARGTFANLARPA